MLTYRQYIEAFGSSFAYAIPDDPEQQISDFYMLVNLNQMSSLDNKRMHQGADMHQGIDIGNQYSVGSDVSNEDEINYTIKEMLGKLVPYLKENLLDHIFEAIVGELEHIRRIFDLSFLRRKYRKTDPEKLKIIEKFVLEGIWPQDEYSFIKLAKELFNLKGWGPAFGGEAWAVICQAWLDLYNSKHIKTDIIQMDHIYDLHHNTGNILTKIDDYSKGESRGLDWIQNLLDKKAEMTSLYELIDNVSPQVKNLALRALKAKTGSTLDSYNKNDKEQRDLEIVSNNARNIRLISNPSKATQMAAVNIDADAIENIKNPDRDVQMIAVKKKPYTYHSIANPDPKVTAYYKKALE